MSKVITTAIMAQQQASLPITSINYKLKVIPRVDLADLRLYFPRLPADVYTSNEFRFRRYSTFRQEEDGFIRLPQQPFSQSSNRNSLCISSLREIQGLEASLTESNSFKELLFAFLRLTGLGCVQPSPQIGVHQIRVITRNEETVLMTPDGIHQEGYDFIGIYCVNNTSIRGAITKLFRSPDKASFFERTLLPGELLLLNDRTLFHHITPMGRGHRDIFVLTA